MALTEGSSVAAPLRPLPRPAAYHGPGITKVFGRVARALAGGWILAVVVLVADGPRPWQVVAGGTVVPGGSYLLLGHPILFVLFAVLAALLAAGWWATGIAVLPGMAVGLPILLALATGTGEPSSIARLLLAVAPLLLTTTVVTVRRRRLVEARHHVDEANAYLSMTSRREIRPSDISRELDDYELGRARHLWDLALQPLDCFDGFDQLDQIREGALRYQVSTAGWALAALQQNRLPAFTGYQAAAQRRLIEKMLVRRIWSIRFWENLWGNFRIDPEPILHHNIMYSGYLLLPLALYEQTTGDDSFRRPGSLEMRWNDRKVFRHSHDSVADAVADNFQRSELCFYACEPHWVYLGCNQVAFAGLAGTDVLHGTDRAGPLRARFDEAMTIDFATLEGRAVNVRSDVFGVTLPFLATALAGDLLNVFFLNAMIPDVAERNWLLTKRNFLRLHDGELDITRGFVDRVDGGNYTRSEIFADATIYLAASEMGDHEYARAAKKLLLTKFPPVWTDGRAAHPGSISINNLAAVAAFGGHNSFRRLLTQRGATPLDGPHLSDVAYPDVLVRSALADGGRLRCVLSPGGTPGERHTLRLAGLVPGRRYELEGATDPAIEADHTGQASCELLLAERLVFTATPAS